MRLLIWICLVCLGAKMLAQDTDSILVDEQTILNNKIEVYKNKIDSLKSRLGYIKDSLQTYPYWSFGGGMLTGLDFNNFSNWANRGTELNSSATSFTLGVNGYANVKGEHHFWRNRGRLLLGWQRFRQSDEDTDAGFDKTADMFQLISHYGYNIAKEFAMSVLSEWQSNIFDQAISPSYLDLSLGFTWSPNPYLVGILHPVNYNFALADQDMLNSSIGTKLLVEYNRSLESLSLQSSFSGFLSYEELDFLSNFTWTNGLNIKVFKHIGLGVEYALRVSKQETYTLNITSETLQSYFLLGMSYEIP